MGHAMEGMPKLLWLPGGAARAVREAARRIREARFPCPDESVFERLAAEAEQRARAEFEDINLGDPSQDRFVADKITRINRFAERGPEEMVLAAELAESPIETVLGCWLCLFGTYGYGELTLELAWNSRPDPAWGALFCPQVPIGDVRPDFVVKACHDGAYRVLAVECDGDAVHDRTPEQAERDRRCDRRLLVNGVTVMRFTGREILRDPMACVEEIDVALAEQFHAMLVDAGVFQGGPSRWLRDSMTPVGERPRRRPPS